MRDISWRVWQPAMMPHREHAGHRYVIGVGYLCDEDSWILELSEGKSAPESWSKIPGASTYLPGETFLMATVPDEDPHLEPSISFCAPNGYKVPYEIMLWFMENVAAEVARCRAEMGQVQMVDEADN